MVFAPFGLFPAFIILACDISCKCAVLTSSFDLHISDCRRDFPQRHLGDVACGDADGVQGGRRVEIRNVNKILTLKIAVRIQPAAAQKHICHAVCRQTLVNHFYIKAVQFL
ncbi:hypothetical protein D7X94_12060 [Acutalibacter sp. 1XD8-33]|nr:hypothetical protein D7X94_12060 [Acutalibacter sp. 1XD8-33]